MGLIKNGNSTTFTKIDGIIELMINEINNDQKIKRLLTYYTKQPLAKIGNTIDDKIYYQRDLDIDLKEINKVDVSKNSDKSNMITCQPSLIPYSWQDEKLPYERPCMFVSHLYSGTKLVDKSQYKISILIPFEYIQLADGRNRGHMILEELGYLFNETVTDKESSKELGDLKFSLGNKVYESKITNSKSINLIEIPIEVVSINCREIENNRIIGYR